MDKKDVNAIALTIRSLTIDAVQKANSGHPGLPLGCAELAAVLYGEILKHNPANSSWIDRDRFVLSAGHGSMLLYSILHLAGYKINLDDIRNFRQVNSVCAGHPEYGITDGVEITTGPLGQGLAGAVGMAIAESMLAARFNTPEYTVIDHYTYVLAGEGCLMEGVSAEASSLAGHLQLGKLIVFYDDNRITIDGSADLAFTEDVAGRYEAYEWQVLQGSMYDSDEIVSLVKKAKSDLRPTLIILKSSIGHGAPSVEGTAKAHGAPLGVEGVSLAKKNLGLNPDEYFYVDPMATEYFSSRKTYFEKQNEAWDNLFTEWSQKNPDKRKEWDILFSNSIPDFSNTLPLYKVNDSIATRTASGAVLNEIVKLFLNIVGGSADLQGPNAVALKGCSAFDPHHRDGRYIHFGIREFGMAAISNGIQIHGGLRSFCSTFMVFSDYLRPALRLSALMKLPVIYVLTHDSIFVGEDGPTHQPVETLASLRSIPGVLVLRPGDAEETVKSWEMAVKHTKEPTCLILSRQNIRVYEKEDPDWHNTIECGAYIVRKGSDNPDITIIATGSEVDMALRAIEISEKANVRVVSMICRELFLKQEDTIKKIILGDSGNIIIVEAGISLGWEGFVNTPTDIFSLNDFGLSGPGEKVAESFGFTASALASKIMQKNL